MTLVTVTGGKVEADTTDDVHALLCLAGLF
jgi:hypothetical protein